MIPFKNFFKPKLRSESVAKLSHSPVLARLQKFRDVFGDFPVIVDLGAAEGAWFQLANKVWPSGRIYAVEPIPDFFRKFDSVDYLNGISNSVVNSSCGPTVLHVNKDRQSSSLIYSGESELLVEGHSLECLLETWGITSEKIFLKTDLQGLDFTALKSSGKYLKNVHAIQMECQLFEYTAGMESLSSRIYKMKDLGFEVVDIFDCLDRPSDGLLGQVDVLFAKSTVLKALRITW